MTVTNNIDFVEGILTIDSSSQESIINCDFEDKINHGYEDDQNITGFVEILLTFLLNNSLT